MSLIKFNNSNRLLPSWSNENLKSFLGSDDFFMNDFFEKDSLMPAMNIKELDTEFKIEFAAPGFSKKDFEVTLNNNMLNVSATKTHEKDEEENSYTLKEFSYNAFKRSLNLPKSVNTDQDVKATYKDGILTLNLQKKAETKKQAKKKIEVL